MIIAYGTRWKGYVHDICIKTGGWGEHRTVNIWKKQPAEYYKTFRLVQGKSFLTPE